jgi:DNA-binding HxlR family transcriptional regulator
VSQDGSTYFLVPIDGTPVSQPSPTLPNVFDPNCGSRRLLQLIADRWTALAVYALADGPMRHGQLMRKLDGVTQKMLTQTLRRLEQSGLVHREIYPVVPPHVEYSLTELGRSLQPVLTALCEWSQDHADVL